MNRKLQEEASMIVWTDDLCSGNAVIDLQHRELFQKINAFLACIKSEDSVDGLDLIIRFLTSYVNFHFGSEERYMDRIRYAHAEAHKKQHRYYTDQLDKIVETVRSNGPSKQLALEAKPLLIDWLINHIKVEDSKLGHSHMKPLTCSIDTLR